MTAFVIDDHEWALMRKVDHLGRDLYIALRRRMDFATGIVGGSAGAAVSWYALREDTELEGRPGVRGCKPTEQQLRRRVAQLEKVGLVESIGNKLRLKFRLLAARTLSLAQKKAGGGSNAPQSAGKGKPDKGSGSYSQGSSVLKADTHPYSGFKTLTPPPTPSGDGHIDPAPSGQEGNPPDEKPSGRARRSSSERRQRGATADKGELAEGRSFRDLAWEERLRWPTGIEDAQRAYIARTLRGMTPEMGQRVLDEWHGAMKAKVIRGHSPWPYFNTLVRNAKELGDAWEAKYADAVAAARATALAVEASNRANDAAFLAKMAAEHAAHEQEREASMVDHAW